jgi:TPR repeat protein
MSVTDARAVARLIDEGRHVEAFGRCRALAEQGDIWAQVTLGWMYHSGTGVERGLEDAKEWYSKAASSNSPEAEYYLASLYRTQERYQEARDWLERSAAQGFPPAIYQLGRVYLFGEGVIADRKKALEYFEDAAQKGHLFARRNIAAEILKGRRGLRRIPVGFIEFVRVLCAVVRVGWHDPDSVLFLRQR